MTRAVWPWLRLLLGVAMLVVLVWRLGSGAFLAGVRATTGPALLGALAIGWLTTVACAWRWCLVARTLGLRLPLGSAVADYYRALFVNSVLPGGVLGDVQRAVGHGRRAGNVGRGVRAVVLERTAGQLVLIALTVLVLLVRPSLVTAEAHSIGPVPAVAVALLAVGLLTVGLALLTARTHRAARWRRRLRDWLVDIRAGLLSREALPGVLLASALVLAGHLAMFVLAARTAGVTAPLGRLLPLLILALLASGLPVNVGGWGPRESAAALLFAADGLGAEQGLTTAVVYGVLALVTSLPGAAVLIVRYVGWLRPARPQVQLEEHVRAEREPAHGHA